MLFVDICLLIRCFMLEVIVLGLYCMIDNMFFIEEFLIIFLM